MQTMNFVLAKQIIDSLLMFHLRLSLKASTPYLEIQYGPPVALTLPNTLATFTTLPLAFLMSGRTLRVTAITPFRFTSSMDL